MRDFTTHTTITELTEENLELLRAAQFAAAGHALTTHIDGYSDDGFDYLNVTIDLANVLLEASYELEVFTIEQLRYHLAAIAGAADYVADAVYAMLFDDDDHLETYDVQTLPPEYDNVHPSTWKLAD